MTVGNNGLLEVFVRLHEKFTHSAGIIKVGLGEYLCDKFKSSLCILVKEACAHRKVRAAFIGSSIAGKNAYGVGDLAECTGYPALKLSVG